jgi:hypothetical protein
MVMVGYGGFAERGTKFKSTTVRASNRDQHQQQPHHDIATIATIECNEAPLRFQLLKNNTRQLKELLSCVFALFTS